MLVNNGSVLITGATSGIGLSTASHLSEKGYTVYGTYRETSDTLKLDQAIEKSNGLLKKVLMDVTDETSVQDGVRKILSEGQIDVVINNAGYALIGTVESCTFKEHQNLFDTNYFGAVRVIKAVLPHFREKSQGQIINIGSVAGIDTFCAIEVYSASKFALKGLTESMAISLSSFNIKVSIIEPAGVKTPAAAKNQPIGTEDLGENNPYENFHEVAHEMCITNLEKGSDPIDLAQFIHTIILEKEPKVRYPFGDFAEHLAKGRFKDPSGTENKPNLIKMFAERGLLAEPSTKL